MKFYLFSILLFFLFWLIVSSSYTEPIWWSIFSSDRSTHTPLLEQISIIKFTFAALVLAGIGTILTKWRSK